MASYPIIPIHTVTDNNGKPVPGAKVYFYAAGTTTALDLFSDNGLSAAIANPVVADAYGRFVTPFFAGGAFKIVATTSADATLNWPAIDNYSSFIQSVSGSVPINAGGTGADNGEDALTNLGAARATDLSDLSTSLTEVVDQLAGIPGGVLGDVASLGLVTPAYTTGMAELCIQSDFVQSLDVTSVSTNVGTGTTPTNANGTSLLSLAFTPSRDDSTLIFEANINIYCSDGDQVSPLVYLCRSDSTNAVQISFCKFEASAVGQATVFLRHRLDQGDTDAVTWSIRGACQDSGDSWTMNTSNWGGISKSSLSIKEVITTPIA